MSDDSSTLKPSSQENAGVDAQYQSPLPNQIVIRAPKTELAPLTPHVLTLAVTQEDLYWSERTGLRNPILCALQRQTKTLWRLYDDGFALEAMPPYRACQLPPDALKQWKQWQVTGQLEESQWQIELVANEASDGYSFIQHRHTNLKRKPRLECDDDDKLPR